MTAGRTIFVLGTSVGGRDRAAEAIADAVCAIAPPGVRVEVADFFKRFAPRLAGLSAIAHRGGAALVPDGMCDLAGLAGGGADETVVRELVSRAVPALEAAVEVKSVVAVVSTDPLAAAAAADIGSRRALAAVSVVCELVPCRVWTHPGTHLTCVADDAARERAVLQGVPWDRLAVTGIPARAGYAAAGRADAREAAGRPQAVVVLPGVRSLARASIVAALAASGMRALDASDGDPSEGARDTDLFVCSGDGELLWSAAAAGIPCLLFGEVPAAERPSADLLVTAGAALAVRDVEHLSSVAAYLDRHPERLGRLGAAARAMGRPEAARAVAERVVGLVG